MRASLNPQVQTAGAISVKDFEVTGQTAKPVVAVASSAAGLIDASAGDIQKITIGGAHSMGIANGVLGQMLTLICLGTSTLTLASATTGSQTIKMATAGTIAPGSATSFITIQFHFDGTNWCELARTSAAAATV